MKCRCGRDLVLVSSGRWAHAENPTWQHHYPRPVPMKALSQGSSSCPAAPETARAERLHRHTPGNAGGTAA